MPAQRKLEGLQRIEFCRRGKAKVDSRNAIQRLGKVLNHGTGSEGLQRSIAGGSIAGPAGPRSPGTVDRVPKSECVWNPPHGEFIRQVTKAIQIFQYQAEFSHQPGIFEIGFQRGIEFGHEQRVVLRQRSDEGRVDGEIVLGRMTGAAGAAIAGKRLIEEDLPAFFDELGAWIRWRGRCGQMAGRPHQYAARDSH